MIQANQVILVSGASKGIGKAIALKAGSEGASVVVNYRTDKSGADDVVSEIGSYRAIAVQADMAVPAEVSRLVEAAVARFGKIDVLVANAAAAFTTAFESVTEADFDAAFGLNVKGPLFLTQAAFPFMANGSRIIFISSDLTDFSALPSQLFLYIATKAALNIMVRSLAQALAKRGIRVNAVLPGPVETESFVQANNEENTQALTALSPFNRLGRVGEVADAVSLLWRGESNWISGQVIKVNGAEC
ncbi:uncharacterized protein RHO25_006997 [Cercospora beticola]|uniref:Versicolorin reductase n=1 Tax=Cercospora beticola TaxID=122368 RepID=A0ABZ0NS10_CERBT|nr:hypothetical protein RHO25_006997 [Cercospora beticola]